jgi:hypothetical protein
MTDRSKIIAKIRSLLQKTYANGCTEAEAMAAAAKAAELMAAYDLSMTDVEIGATECTERHFDAGDRDHPITWVLNAIAEFTDTRVWLAKSPRFVATEQADLFEPSTDGRTEWRAEFVFFGLAHDVEIAGYLVGICKSAMARASQDFRAGFGNQPRNGAVGGFRFGERGRGRWDPAAECAARLPSFLVGMADAMTRTLRLLKAAQRREQRTSGRDLAVVKHAIVERALEARGIRLGKGGSRRLSLGHGYHDGYAAGARVAFNPGVRANGRPLGLPRE